MVATKEDDRSRMICCGALVDLAPTKSSSNVILGISAIGIAGLWTCHFGTNAFGILPGAPPVGTGTNKVASMLIIEFSGPVGIIGTG